MQLPIPVYTTVTIQDRAALDNPTDITGVAVGTSPDRPRPTDTGLKKGMAVYPAYARIEQGFLRVYTAMEYGTHLGVYEMGIYAGDKLIATINQKSRYAIKNPIFTLRNDRTYILDIRIDPMFIDGVQNRGSLEMFIDERDDITYPMAMAMQHNTFLSAVAGVQEDLINEVNELSQIVDTTTTTLTEHNDAIGELKDAVAQRGEQSSELQRLGEQAIALAEEIRQSLVGVQDSQNADKKGFDNKIINLTAQIEEAKQEALNKVKLKSKNERLIVMHDGQNNMYELTLTDVARGSALAAEIIRRQHEDAEIRELIEKRVEGKLDERAVKALIAEAELDDVTRDEIKLKIIEQVADKISGERVAELLAHKTDRLEVTNLLAFKANQEEMLAYLTQKADEQDVQVKLDAKANQTEMMTALFEKADKTDVPTHAQVDALLTPKADRSEVLEKIKEIDDKVGHNHKLIDGLSIDNAKIIERLKVLEIAANQLANLRSESENLVISRDGDSVTLRLANTPNDTQIMAMQHDIDTLKSQMNTVPNQIAEGARVAIGVLTEGASHAMNTFAEVERAINDGGTVATGILNAIAKLQERVDALTKEARQDESYHRQFTGYKTSTNLTDIVGLILDNE